MTFTPTRNWAILIASCSALLLSIGCTSTGIETVQGWESYGESVTLQERTPIAEILSRPDDFVGQTVAVDGRVTEVCAMMGCWIEIQDENSSQIRLKVEDGVIVFPQEVVGRRAVLQGKVEKITYTREDFEAKAKHEAEERGKPFDPESIQPPFEEIRLWGSGAMIEVPRQSS